MSLNILIQQLQYYLINYSWLMDVIYGIVLIIILFLLFLIFKSIIKKTIGINCSFRKVTLLITIPKENGEEEKKKTVKEMLLPMESFFDNIGGLRAQRGLKSRIFSRSDHFSFEIVSGKDNVISFYIVVPKYLQGFFEQQIRAQYPAVEIEEVKDYNIFLPHGVVIGAYLKLKKSSIFPIKTYLKSGVDGLNAVANSLSKIKKGDAAVIQIIARSARGEWHQKGAKIAQKMQQGKTLNKALASDSVLSSLNTWKDIINPKNREKEAIEPKKIHQLSPMEQEIVKALEEKTSKAGFDVNIRVVVSAKNKEDAQAYLNDITNSFSQYTGYQYLNGFKAIKTRSKRLIYDFIYRNFNEKTKFILNTEEITSIFHLPLPTTEIPNVRWLIAKRAPAPVGIPTEGIILGKNIYRGEEKIIRIKKNDRRRHVYVVGKTGTGKTYFLINMILQDIANGDGVCFIDPHGDAVETILTHIPKERAEDVIYFDPSNVSRPMGLNLLEYDPKYPQQKTFAINEMINIMDKLYDLRQTGGPMFEQYMRNAMLLVMADPASGSTLMEISKVLSDADFRHYKLDHSNNPVVNDFWIKQAEKAGGEAALSNMVPYITSKLTQFVANDMMRPIIGQQKSAFDFRDVMDKKKILLINLSKGKIGDMNAYLLGLVLVGKILMAALSRTDIPEEERKDFYLYIDEFQNFITESINTILAEARKYRLSLAIAHQYLGQLVKGQDTSMRDAIFGTVGTIVSFKVGMEDAEILAKEFQPIVTQYDLINVEKYNAYIKLLVDNQSTKAFNIRTVNLPKGNTEIAKIIKQMSSLKYGRPKAEVEKEILERRNLVVKGENRGEEEEEIDIGKLA